MPVCPRCKHPTDPAPTTSTQCGATVRGESDQQSSLSLAKTLFVLVLLVLLAFFLILMMEFMDVSAAMNKLD
jgi:hypothetical protein